METKHYLGTEMKFDNAGDISDIPSMTLTLNKYFEDNNVLNFEDQPNSHYTKIDNTFNFEKLDRAIWEKYYRSIIASYETFIRGDKEMYCFRLNRNNQTEIFFLTKEELGE